MRGKIRAAIHLTTGGLLVAVAIWIAKGPPEVDQGGGRLVFSEADVAQVRASFERTWSRPPTPAELRKAFDRYVREEVLYREALARGLDQNDPVVRMTLVRKITMLGTAQAEARQPSDAEIRAFFELRSDRYRIPGTIGFQQVCLDPNQRTNAVADAEAMVARFNAEEPNAEDLPSYGDMVMLATVFEDADEGRIGREFGSRFRNALEGRPMNQWFGPIVSGYGVHVVKITELTPGRLPDWTEVRDRIETDMNFEDRRAAEAQFYSEVLPRYRVVYEDDVEQLLVLGEDKERGGAE